MIVDFNRTVKRLLHENGKLGRSEVDIAFEQPTGDWSSRLNRPTLNLWCFDMRENMRLRSMEMRTQRNGNMGSRNWVPRRFDLMYLVTAWARKVDDEHQLLWRALTTLMRFPSLPPRNCEGLLQYQSHDVILMTATVPDEQPVNLVDLWGVLDNQMRLGFTLIATVELDPEMGTEAPLVLEKTLRFGQSQVPSERKIDVPDKEITQKAKDISQEDED